LCTNIYASNIVIGSPSNKLINDNLETQTVIQIDNSSELVTSKINIKDSTVSNVKHPKLTAAILAVTLGMFGAHRLYFGCKPWVPLFYVLTVGGVFFILPLIDLIAILATKDVSKFYNNTNILMWMKKVEK